MGARSDRAGGLGFTCRSFDLLPSFDTPIGAAHAAGATHAPCTTNYSKRTVWRAALLTTQAFDNRRWGRNHCGRRITLGRKHGQATRCCLWPRRVRVFSRYLSLRNRFCRQSSRSADDRFWSGRAVTQSVDRERPSLGDLRDPAQRDGAPGVQAVVDATRAELCRAQHLRPVRECGPRATAVAVAADRRARVDGHRTGGRCSPPRRVFPRLVLRVAQHVS